MRRNNKTREMTLYGVFIAILAILSLTPLGYIPVLGVSITIIHIIVLIAAFTLGFKGGVIMGFAMGVFSLIRAAVMPNSPFDLAFLNPLVSILPRVLFGVVAGLFANLANKITDKVKYRFAIAGLSGVATLLHSVFVLPLLYWQYTRMDEYAEILAFVTETPFFAAVGATIVSNSILEAVAAIIIVPLVCMALSKYVINRHKVKESNNMKQYKDSLVKDLVGWIKIDSVEDPKTVTKEHPFGEGVNKALNYIADLAKRDGFKVKIYDGYCTEITYDGLDDEYVGILGHCDVVSTGSGWKHNPFGGEIENNVIYGRGSNDDKGPTLAAYYALKAIKDRNIKLKHAVKIIVGGNEETGSKCMEHYFETLHMKAPIYGFTPDADFPLIYGEKGMVEYAYTGENYIDEVIESIHGGVSHNAVPSVATIVFKKDMSLKEDYENYCKEHNYKCEYKLENGKTTLVMYGVAAHGSTPEFGVNALTNLLYYVSTKKVSTFANHFGPRCKEYSGEGFGIKGEGPKMGKLTMNIGICNYENGKYQLTVDIRCPIDINNKEVLAKLNSQKLHDGDGITVEPLYFDPNSKLIKTLCGIYQDVSKDYETKPMTIGGGTYAKSTENVVAFGMTFLTRKGNGTGNIHTIDEGQNIDDLMDGAEIYYRAILALGNMD